MRLVESPVTAPDARLMLDQYFASRELDFPPHLGTYRVTLPDPAQFVPPAGVFLVVRADAGGDGAGGAPLGCGGIRRLDLPGRPGGRTYEVKHVWLEQEARGQGWAGILMQALEDRARAFGADTLVLDTNASLLGAAKLYARLGYEGIPAYNSNPNATNWYRKALTPAAAG